MCMSDFAKPNLEQRQTMLHEPTKLLLFDYIYIYFCFFSLNASVMMLTLIKCRSIKWLVLRWRTTVCGACPTATIYPCPNVQEILTWYNWLISLLNWQRTWQWRRFRLWCMFPVSMATQKTKKWKKGKMQH